MAISRQLSPYRFERDPIRTEETGRDAWVVAMTRTYLRLGCIVWCDSENAFVFDPDVLDKGYYSAADLEKVAAFLRLQNRKAAKKRSRRRTINQGEGQWPSI